MRGLDQEDQMVKWTAKNAQGVRGLGIGSVLLSYICVLENNSRLSPSSAGPALMKIPQIARLTFSLQLVSASTGATSWARIVDLLGCGVAYYDAPDACRLDASTRWSNSQTPPRKNEQGEMPWVRPRPTD